jgi:hypothetical protein
MQEIALMHIIFCHSLLGCGSMQSIRPIVEPDIAFLDFRTSLVT